jgi:hypothetical protein
VVYEICRSVSVDLRDIRDYQTTSNNSRSGRMAGPTACETRWTKTLVLYEIHRDVVIAGHPDAGEEKGLVHTALTTIVQLVRTSPSVKGTALCGNS